MPSSPSAWTATPPRISKITLSRHAGCYVPTSSASTLSDCQDAAQGLRCNGSYGVVCTGDDGLPRTHSSFLTLWR